MYWIGSAAANQQASLYGHTIQCYITVTDTVCQNQITADSCVGQCRSCSTDHDIACIYLWNGLSLINIVTDQCIHNLSEFSSSNAALGIQPSIRTADISALNQCCETVACPIGNCIAVRKCVQSWITAAFQRKCTCKYGKCLLARDCPSRIQFSIRTLEGAHLYSFCHVCVIPCFCGDIAVAREGSRLRCTKCTVNNGRQFCTG